MKITLNVEASTAQELLDALSELSDIGAFTPGVCGRAPVSEQIDTSEVTEETLSSVGIPHTALKSGAPVFEVKTKPTDDDPRDVYGSGNGPVDAAQPIPSEAASVEPELPEHDANGEVWSEDLHASPPKINKDGTWRKRRGVATAPQGTVTPVEDTPAPAPAPAVATELTVSQFMEKIGMAVANGTAQVDYIQSLNRDFELQSLADLATDQDKFAAVLAKVQSDGVL